MDLKEKILKIMSLALEINPPEIEYVGIKRTAVFVSWAPHCNMIDLAIFKNGWKSGSTESECKRAYTDWDDSDEQLDALIERLEEIKKEIEE